MRDRKEPLPSEDALEIARTIKEKYGYVCKDVLQEFKKFDKKEKSDDGKYYLNKNPFLFFRKGFLQFKWW